MRSLSAAMQIPGFGLHPVKLKLVCLFLSILYPTSFTLASPRSWQIIVPAVGDELVEYLAVPDDQIQVLRESLQVEVRRLYASADSDAGRDGAEGNIAVGDVPVQAVLQPGDFVLPAEGVIDSGQGDGIRLPSEFFDRWGPLWAVDTDVPLLTTRRPAAVPPPKEPLTFQRAFGEDAADLDGSPMRVAGWHADGDHYIVVRDNRPWKVTADTGRLQRLYDADQLAEALRELPEFSEEAAEDFARRAWEHLDKQHTRFWFDYRQDLYAGGFDPPRAARLTHDRSTEEVVSFSPDGTLLGFVRDNDLYTVDIDRQHEERLTFDGGALIRSGKADWVYYEEVNLRDWKSYEWSADSQYLAFLRTDDSPVQPFTLVDPLEIRQQVESERYPLAGQPNPRVQLGVVPARGGDVRWLDLSLYSPDHIIISGFGWSDHGNRLYAFVQDRTQTWLDLYVWDVDASAESPTEPVLRQVTQAWVDPPLPPIFLHDGSLLLTNQYSGWRHLYHYESDGSLRKQITDGPWEIREIHGLDPDQEWIYFSGTRDSQTAENLYRVRLDGSQLTRLTSQEGHHRVLFSPTFRWAVDRWSSFKQPERVQLLDGKGTQVRMLDTNPVEERRRFALGRLRQVEIPTRDGIELPGLLVVPPHYREGERYPLWMMTYGGPHSPSVRDAWDRGRALEQVLANLGVVVLKCDPRSATGQGAASSWTAYRQLGVQETRDLEDAARWAVQQGLADPQRIGLSGYSYGGFLTAFALTHSRDFCAGIAGGSVTDWRNYDTIYTERYMGLPQENTAGYQESSVVAAAKDLHGRLLLVHGAMDDNVHLANAMQLAHALQEAEKPFEIMVYPGSRHGIYGRHYRRLTVDFICRSLGVSPPDWDGKGD